MRKKIVLTLITVVLVFTVTALGFMVAKGAFTTQASSSVTNTLQSRTLSSGLTLNESSLTQQALGFMHKLQAGDLLNQFTFENGNLGLKLPLSDLETKYQFSATDVHYMAQMLAFAQHARTEIDRTTGKSNINPNISIRSWVIYFTNSDVIAFLYLAAYAGPAALAAALSFVASIFGGPIGTVVGVILAAIGGLTLSNICYTVIQALQTRKGVYIGISWNGWWPNIIFGIWHG